MRDWLSHLVLSELYERRQRDTISVEGCQVVRDAVKRGELPAAVTYLVEEADSDEGRGTAWFDTELRTALQAWEADGTVPSDTAAAIRERLDAEAWAGAAELLIGD